MSVSIQKLEGVRAATVSLNEGRAAIELEPGNKVTWAQIRERVQGNGFTPQAATVTVRARVVAAGDRFQLEVPETKETFDTAATPHARKRSELNTYVGQVVIVEGIIAAHKDKTAAVIQVTNVTVDSPKR